MDSRFIAMPTLRLSPSPGSPTFVHMNHSVPSSITGVDLTGQQRQELDLDGSSLRKKKLRVVSLFAGIGGFDRAFENVGGRVLFQCELDKFCRAVLKRHWPKAQLAEDITKVNAEDIPEADVWTAGFPCQDVSLARGNHGRTGLKGHHTSLFFKLMDLVEHKKPKVLLLENVVGLLNSHKGADFAIILRELTKHGYAVSWRVLNARYFGVPQTRSRVFICAWQGDYRRALAALYEPVPGARYGRERVGFITPTSHPTGAIVPEVAYCVAATSGRHTGNDWARSYVSYKDRVRRPTPTESERLQGFPAGWTVPDNSFPMPSRGLDSERYRAAGNAVAVPVVTWVANRIAELAASNRPTAVKRSFDQDILRLAPDLQRDKNVVDFDWMMAQIDTGEFAHRWKSGGCAWDKGIVEGKSSMAPSIIPASKFVDILDADVPDDRYFLTSNAAVGIIRRADIVGRNLFPPMRHALEKMVGRIREVPPIRAEQYNAGDTGGQSSICAPRADKRRTVAEAR